MQKTATHHSSDQPLEPKPLVHLHQPTCPRNGAVEAFLKPFYCPNVQGNGPKLDGYDLLVSLYVLLLENFKFFLGFYGQKCMQSLGTTEVSHDEVRRAVSLKVLQPRDR